MFMTARVIEEDEEQTLGGSFILIIFRDAFLDLRIDTSTKDITWREIDVHETLCPQVSLDNCKEFFCL